jgi:hypothetical protein
MNYGVNLMKRSILITISSLAIVTAIAIIFYLRNTVVDKASQAQVDTIALEENSNAMKTKLLNDFEFSHNSRPIYQGDKFPLLGLPNIAGPAVDWHKATVITVGTVTSSSALLLHESLKTALIQKIHIISTSTYSGEELKKFPKDVIILDATIPRESNLSVSKNLFDALGIYVGVAAYLIDEDRNILHAQINHGEFSEVVLATLAFLSKGKATVTPNNETVLVSGNSLETEGLNLPDNVKQEIDKELSKPMSIVLFSDKTSCDVCSGWLVDANTSLKSWHENGYGLIIVEADKNQVEFEVSTLDNGLVQVLDKFDPISKKPMLFERWGVNIYPVFYIIKKGIFQGQVAYVETEANGNIYRNVPFEVVDTVVNNLAHPVE